MKIVLFATLVSSFYFPTLSFASPYSLKLICDKGSSSRETNVEVFEVVNGDRIQPRQRKLTVPFNVTLSLEPNTVVPVESELIVVNKLNVYLGDKEDRTDAMILGDKSGSEYFMNIETIPHNINSVSVVQQARSSWREGSFGVFINGDSSGLYCKYQYL